MVEKEPREVMSTPKTATEVTRSLASWRRGGSWDNSECHCSAGICGGGRGLCPLTRARLSPGSGFWLPPFQSRGRCPVAEEAPQACRSLPACPASEASTLGQAWPWMGTLRIPLGMVVGTTPSCGWKEGGKWAGKFLEHTKPGERPLTHPGACL